MRAGRERLDTLTRLQRRAGRQLRAALRQVEGRPGRRGARAMLLALLRRSAGHMESLCQAVSAGPPRPMAHAPGNVGGQCRRWRRLLARWRRALGDLADDNELDVGALVGGRRFAVGECIAQAIVAQACLAGRLTAWAERPGRDCHGLARPHKPVRPVGKSIGLLAPAAATMRPCAGLRVN